MVAVSARADALRWWAVQLYLAHLSPPTRHARGLQPKAWGIHSLGELLILGFRTEHQPYDTVEAFYSMKSRQWLFTIFLFVSYIAIFHVWE